MTQCCSKTVLTQGSLSKEQRLDAAVKRHGFFRTRFKQQFCQERRERSVEARAIMRMECLNWIKFFLDVSWEAMVGQEWTDQGSTERPEILITMSIWQTVVSWASPWWGVATEMAQTLGRQSTHGHLKGKTLGRQRRNPKPPQNHGTNCIFATQHDLC